MLSRWPNRLKLRRENNSLYANALEYVKMYHYKFIHGFIIQMMLDNARLVISRWSALANTRRRPLKPASGSACAPPLSAFGAPHPLLPSYPPPAIGDATDRFQGSKNKRNNQRIIQTQKKIQTGVKQPLCSAEQATDRKRKKKCQFN